MAAVELVVVHLSLFSSSDSLHREVTTAEVEELQRSTNLVVLPITNTPGPRMASDPSLPDGREGIKVSICRSLLAVAC